MIFKTKACLGVNEPSGAMRPRGRPERSDGSLGGRRRGRERGARPPARNNVATRPEFPRPADFRPRGLEREPPVSPQEVSAMA